jgi:glucose/arabinose dehydrogenase
MTYRLQTALLACVLVASCADDDANWVPPEQRPDAGPPQRDFALVFEGIELEAPLERPSAMAFIPGAGMELLVLEQRRRVSHYVIEGDPEGEQSARKLGSFVVPDLFTDIDCGLISLVFDPAFAENHYVYIGMCVSVKSSGVFRFTFDASDYGGIVDSMREIILETEPDAVKAMHNVGSLGFDSEGHMWILFGDKKVDANASETANNLGGVVRIDPSRDPDAGGYEPAGFVYEDNDALIAHGLRSPWRGVMDARGRLFVGDVGDETTEELNLIEIGGDHGWPKYEGPCRKSCSGLVNPLTSWKSEDDTPYVLDDPEAAATTRRVAWIGAAYQDHGNDRYEGELTGRLLFGDMCSGFLRVLQLDDDDRIVLDRHVGHRAHLTDAKQAEDGYLYALTYGGCAFNRGTHPGGALFRVQLGR